MITLNKCRKCGQDISRHCWTECLVIQRDQLVEKLARIESAADKLAQRHLLVPTTYPQAQAHVREYQREKATP